MSRVEMERNYVVRLNSSRGCLVGAGGWCSLLYLPVSSRFPHRDEEALQFPLELISRPPAWVMSLPSWTTAEHISWMFCPDPVSGVLTGVDVFELVLTEELSGAGALLEAASEGADEDSGAELEEVVGGGACCCVVVVG